MSDQHTRQSPGLEATLSQHILTNYGQKKDCVMILPATNSPWINMVSAHIVDLMELSKPFQTSQFIVLLKPVWKKDTLKYPHTMIAVKKMCL